jgi:hypothetical protein
MKMKTLFMKGSGKITRMDGEKLMGFEVIILMVGQASFFSMRDI